MATLNDLPVETHIQILSYLNWQTKYRCSIASKAWRNVLLAHGQDARLADCRHYEVPPLEMDSSIAHPDPERPGFHSLFQGNLMCYIELGSDGNIAAIAFAPRIRALLKPPKTISPTMQYPIIASPGYCFLLNDPIFERTPDLPKNGAEDPRRLSLEMSLGENHRRYQVQNKVWLFSEEPRLDKITIKELLDLVVENLREHDSSGWSPNRKRVRVRMRKASAFLTTVYAELFEIPEQKPKGSQGRIKRLVAFGQRSQLVC
ncbi:hypothetical protein TWF281_003118 [Arthrobotrys megalospora]